MDATIAHLDRGWDLVGRGEFAKARVSAEHALANDPDHPGGHTLLGAIAAAEGEPEEAIELFRQALDVDPEHVDAMLYAAELAIHPLGEIDYALRLCDEAEELLGDSQDSVEVKLLRAEAFLARGEFDRATSELDRLPAPPYTDPAQYLRAGRALLDVERPDQAADLLQRVVEHPIYGLDALYFLGVAREIAGDVQGALRQFLSVYERDRGLTVPPWTRPAEDLHQIVRALLERFPEPIATSLREAPLRIEQYPPMELVAEGFDPRAAVFFAGTLTPSKSTVPTASSKRRRRKRPPRDQLLTAIFVYQRNVERYAGSAAALGEELLLALLNEVAFFFDLDPDDLQEMVGVTGD